MSLFNMNAVYSTFNTNSLTQLANRQLDLYIRDEVQLIHKYRKAALQTLALSIMGTSAAFLDSSLPFHYPSSIFKIINIGLSIVSIVRCIDSSRCCYLSSAVIHLYIKARSRDNPLQVASRRFVETELSPRKIYVLSTQTDN